jgi:serine/threonine-protein kinase RsbW
MMTATWLQPGTGDWRRSRLGSLMSAHHAHVAIGELAPGQVAEALDAFCEAERLPHDVAWRLRVALDEIVANVVAYGVPAVGRAGLDVWFRREGPLVEITVADDGPPFNPLERPAPDVTLPLETRQPGGLGIALVRSLMDDVVYERDARNRLTIRKRFDEHPADHP